MKKLLLMLTVLCGTVSAWAGVTDLPEMSTEGNIKWYTIKNTRSTSGSYLYWAGDNVGVKDSNTKTSKSLFYFTGTAEACYIHNAMTDKLFASETSWTESGTVCTISETPHSTKAGVSIGFKGTFLNEQNHADGYTTWDADDAGSIFVLELATEEEIANAIKAEKDAAINILNQWSSLSVVFDASLLATAKANIENLSTLETIAQVGNELKNVTDDVASKCFTLRNSDTKSTPRIDAYLAANMSDNEGHGTKNFSYNATWKFVYAGGASFYLQNETNNVYLGTPASNGDLLTGVGSAGLYTFEVIDSESNKVELKCSGQTLHLNNHTDGLLSNYDNDDAASRWYIATYDYMADLQKLIDENTSNHAEIPALGQYLTSNYNALCELRDSEPTFIETYKAMTAFNASLNKPVYFITSAFEGGYPDGSAILYNGSQWRWATANIYNKQMWMTIPGYTQPDVPVVDAYAADGTNYEICDYLTGTVMRGKKVQIVKIAGWDGAMNLQYSTNTNDAVQHAQNGGLLVGWNPAAIMEGGTKDCSASAWHVEYIGTSYELGQLSEEYFNAAAELAALSIPNFVYGTGVNNYSDANKPALDAAIANRADVLRKLSTADEIAAAKAQLEAAIAGIEINLPENGKFYRLRCTGSGMKYMQFTQNTDANRFDMISGGDGITVNATFCYINGGLVAYANPMYINHDGNNASYKMTPTTVTFSEATNVLGQYFIKVGGRYLFGDGNKSDSGGTPDNRAGYRWWLEEVTTLPVTITSAGYATFFAPVAVEIPEGVEAYYTEEVGENAVVLTAIEGGVIPANTGVILKGEANTYNFNITADAEAVVGNKLAGTCASTYVSEDAYVLSKVDGVVGMYKALKNQEEGASWLNNGFKAYLPATAGGEARFLVFNFGTETGIDELKGENGNVKAEIYDLSGRRVQNAQKGLYIVKGKKVVR